MTVRELINILLNFEADETIDLFIEDIDHCPRVTIAEISETAELPYIILKEV